MRSHEFIFESLGSTVYHVTATKNVPSIQQNGLKPLQDSNWSSDNSDGERYNTDGGVFAFEHPRDAASWAFKQEFELKQDVSIVKLQRTDSWEVDPSNDYSLTNGAGKALKSMEAIPPQAVLGSVPFKVFGSPVQKDMTSDEWFDMIIKVLQ